MLRALAALTAVLAVSAQEAVRVVETVQPFPVLVAPMDPDSWYPARDAAAMAAAEAALAARRRELDDAAAAADPAGWLIARHARGTATMFGRAQGTGPDGDATRAPWAAWQARIDAQLAADATAAVLRARIAAARRAPAVAATRALAVVDLDSGALAVRIVPGTGLRVLNAIDAASGRSLAGTADPRAYERGPWLDQVPWMAGIIEANLPFWEHGMGVDTPAGWRLVRHGDGAVTVAMQMRFTAATGARQALRYGRWGDRPASMAVTVRPGDARLRVRIRLDNHLPLRRSPRIWAASMVDAAAFDARHLLFPAGVIVPHGGAIAHPFWAAGGAQTWAGVSHFALFPEHRFCGVYDPAHDAAALIIPDPGQPGMKLYTDPTPPFAEFWLGTVPTFEHPGGFRPGFVPADLGWTAWVASGIGRPDWAGGRVALRMADGALHLAVPVACRLRVEDGAGAVLAAGDAAPGRPLRGRAAADGRLRIAIDGAPALDVALPLTFADTRPRLTESGGIDSFLLEGEELAVHNLAPSPAESATIGARLLAGPVGDPAFAASIARTWFRLGGGSRAVALAAAAAAADPALAPDADLLAGLQDLEDGRIPGFAVAGSDAHYHRALLAIRAGDRVAAARWCALLVAERPTAVLPRLLGAVLRGERRDADAVLMENPACVEALVALDLLGDPAAAADLARFTSTCPETVDQAAAFRASCTRGAWRWVRRWRP
ncbi:MAG: hypothetical protein RLZZ127_3179 [Planctomycetota bacterium]|jgi:hypothetical protein